MTAIPHLISPQELRQRMARDPGLAPVDVRTPDEYEEVRVPRARNFPLGSLMADRLLDERTVSPSRPVSLICQTDNRATIAAEKFLAAGHPQTFVVAGGTLGWIAAALPVLRGAPRPGARAGVRAKDGGRAAPPGR